MSASWHIANALKTHGPLTQVDLWSHLKPTKMFTSMSNMKTILNGMRKRERVRVFPLIFSNQKTREHLFSVTSHKSNFITEDHAKEMLEKRKKNSVEWDKFKQRITNAENYLKQQYYATRPTEKANYENHLLTVKRSKRGLQRFRDRAQEGAEALRQRVVELKAEKLESDKAQLAKDANGNFSAKKQPTLEQRRIALELNRVAGERKKYKELQDAAIKKGIAATEARAKMNAELKAHPVGTPERAELDKQLAKNAMKILRAKKAKLAAREKLKRKQLQKGQDKNAVAVRAKKSEKQVTSDDVISAVSETVTAAPPTKFKQVAKQMLEEARAEETKEKTQTKEKSKSQKQ